MTSTGTEATSVPHLREQAVATRLHAAALHLMRQLRREDRALGLSAARLSALSVVVFGGPLTIGELATAEDVTPPTMTRLVAALEADGLIRRRPDAADRRAVRIEPTAKGRRLMERGRSLRTATLARRLATLPHADLDTIERAATLLEGLLQEPGNDHGTDTAETGGGRQSSRARR